MIPAEMPGQAVTGELYQLPDMRHAFEMLDIVEGVRGYESRIRFPSSDPSCNNTGQQNLSGLGLSV